MIRHNKLVEFNPDGMTLEQGFEFLRHIYSENPLGSNEELIYNNTLTKMEELINQLKEEIEVDKKNSFKYKRFHDFIKPNMSPKQKSDYIEYLEDL